MNVLSRVITSKYARNFELGEYTRGVESLVFRVFRCVSLKKKGIVESPAIPQFSKKAQA